MSIINNFIKKHNTSNESTDNDIKYKDYFIDSPRVKHINSHIVHVEGWLIPADFDRRVEILIKMNDIKHIVQLEVPRPDVAGRFDQYELKDIINCGFTKDIEFEDGEITIDLMIDGVAVKELHRMDIIYSPEDLVDMIRNPNLTEYMAKHENTIANKKAYHYEENNPANYARHDSDPRLIAFYLPQYHPFEENDKAWGKGFTEWTNVTAARPRYVGQQQPILPSSLGFYDLRVEQTIKDQIDLAKQHGIYGFCFYYYWFSGKKIMDTPINSFLSHKEWNFNFTICWANENWTKRWDGRAEDVIIGQKYAEDDPLKFIKDVAPILNDPRYIQEDGKPVLIVYRASELKKPSEYTRVWRQYFKDNFNKELFLISAMGFEVVNPSDYGFDCGIDFAPQTTLFKKECFNGSKLPYIKNNIELIDQKFSGALLSYRDVALNTKINKFFDFRTIKSVPTSWDNDARKKGSGFVMHGANPDLYGKWLDNVLKEEAKASIKAPFVFINAWNEWAEGAILEPSVHFGYANLNRTTEILSNYSLNPKNKVNFPAYGNRHIKKNNKAIYIHIYEKTDIVDVLKNITNGFDLYITAILKYKDILDEVKSRYPECYTKILPSRGSDILPFITIVRRLGLDRYESVTKLRLGQIGDVSSISEYKTLTIDDLEGSIVLTKPSEQLNDLQWLDVEDFEPSS